MEIAVLLPAYNEEASIGKVLDAIPDWVDRAVVADNASTDATAEVARAHGAVVVAEPQRGYGAACLRAISAAGAPDIIVFLDGDYSDDPGEMDLLVDPIIRGTAEVVIGSRVLGRSEPGALTPQQRYGNRLACWLMRWFFGVRHSDLGPFRAIRWSTLLELEMADRTWGWTVELQVKAAKQRVRVLEVPVSYRKRIGKSKISGTVRGVLSAGAKIVYTIFKEALRGTVRRAGVRERLIVFTRYPEPGHTKTRLIPALGPEGAAEAHRAMAARTVRIARSACMRRHAAVEIHYAGGSQDTMASWLGPDIVYRAQGDGDLGTRMDHASTTALQAGNDRVVIIGTDCPGLTVIIIRKAIAMLRENDLALGPTDDGGYYLIGLRRPAPEIFDGVAWGTETVYEKTVELAQAAGLTIGMLPTLYDVDTPADLPLWEKTVARETVEAPVLSVIIPTFNEADQIADTLAAIGSSPEVEVIVADGGSTDGTVALARTYGAGVVEAPRGRAVQMNAGAREARGDTLLFLHGDTRVPQGYFDDIRHLLAQEGVVLGGFRLAIDGTGLVYRLIERLANRRAMHRQIPFGDQGLFLRRDLFERIEGFAEIPILEDVEFVARLKQHGRVMLADSAVLTSARRWRAVGPLRLSLVHHLIRLGYRLGVSPTRLAALRK